MKRMKKYLLFLVTVCLLAACSDDDSIPKGKSSLTITAASIEDFNYAESRTFEVKLQDVNSTAIKQPEGWNASLKDGLLTVVAPQKGTANISKSGKIEIVATGNDQSTLNASFEVKVFHYVTFENADESYLAGPTSYGENLYSNYTGEYLYGGYDDLESGLFFHTSNEFYNGGIAISQWNDKETKLYTNQCSVYYGDHNQKNGGHNHSKTFAVAYYSSFSGEEATSIDFIDDNAEYIIDHLYIANSSYAALSMLQGDNTAKKFSFEDKDWLKITIQGFNAAGEKTSKVEAYLADFRKSDAGGVLTDWKRVDLSSLGKVHKIQFSMNSSDIGDYGMNTPAYFCIDDIAVAL